MDSKIILTVRCGALPPLTYAFTGPLCCVIGRGHDCTIQVLEPEVSRHHCVLEVDPPLVRVRDLGSRNGTYVNGINIAWTRKASLSFALHADDWLQIGATIFDIDIVPTACEEPRAAPVGAVVPS